MTTIFGMTGVPALSGIFSGAATVSKAALAAPLDKFLSLENAVADGAVQAALPFAARIFGALPEGAPLPGPETYLDTAVQSAAHYGALGLGFSALGLGALGIAAIFREGPFARAAEMLSLYRATNAAERRYNELNWPFGGGASRQEALPRSWRLLQDIEALEERLRVLQAAPNDVIGKVRLQTDLSMRLYKLHDFTRQFFAATQPYLSQEISDCGDELDRLAPYDRDGLTEWRGRALELARCLKEIIAEGEVSDRNGWRYEASRLEQMIRRADAMAAKQRANDDAALERTVNLFSSPLGDPELRGTWQVLRGGSWRAPGDVESAPGPRPEPPPPAPVDPRQTYVIRRSWWSEPPPPAPVVAPETGTVKTSAPDLSVAYDRRRDGPALDVVADNKDIAPTPLERRDRSHLRSLSRGDGEK